MKKLILAAVAASVIAAPAAAAHNHQVQTKQVRVVKQNGHTVKIKTVKKVQKVHKRKWARGQRFDRRYVQTYRLISNPRVYRLHNAPRGYRWVRADNDAVLIAVTSGIVGAVIANIF